MTKTRIDRLGDRLRQGRVSEIDLQLLDQYRMSFAAAYQNVVETIRHRIPLEVRRELQHLWAQLSEKLSDLLDPTIKYGGGPEEARRVLQSASRMMDSQEDGEKQLFMLSTDLPEGRDQYSEDLKLQIAAIQRTQTRASAKLAGFLTSAITLLKAPGGS